jgi:archaemetzincin
MAIFTNCEKSIDKTQQTNPKNKTIIIQPFEDMPSDLTNKIYIQLLNVYPNIVLSEPINFPKNAFYKPRNRYRADTLIAFLRNKAPKNTVIIGITTKDISATKGKIVDWGVMGLGYRPGNACVVSTFRLKKEKIPEQFYKVCLHEIGHTQNLKHCPDQGCIMRDAEGKNHLDELNSFCRSCTKKMKKRGWHLD